MFQLNYPGAFGRWRSNAAELGIAIDGWDMMPLEEADCVWFLDLPDTRKEFEQARQRVQKGVPFVLQVMETPTGRLQSLQSRHLSHIMTVFMKLNSLVLLFTLLSLIGLAGQLGSTLLTHFLIERSTYLVE